MPLFKQKAKSSRAPVNHYSISAVTQRTKTLRTRAEAFAKQGSVSEATTKEQLIFPFFEALGWDIKNPEQAQFEVVAGGKNKADLMLKKDKAVKLVVEAKAANRSIDNDTFRKQLSGYFNNCHASIGVLTNGIQYDFFSYAEYGSEMSMRPFASMDIRAPRFGERNSFVMYMCRPSLDIDALCELGKVMYAADRIPKTRYDRSDRETRETFGKYFPDATPQRLDAMIDFADYHCRKK